ncbi:hypothetical protein [Mastigocoleus sp. MO_188.B34]|uniref:hypothetical protein n=1 Tax=Mastigocoleus sp. MO_188.B34 TaxID=3036635 RepID=UPI00262042D7|nr:hypothetical protein [Mastigocoleus sp. MO_188.B34]MDJ0697238.1 hypothetical protein [Mastigocoleus sp. MO_188.B34]
MTRFPYDQFSKNYLEELLQPLGTVQVAREVAGEVREIDVWFSPNQSVNPTEVSRLGLLGRFTATPAILEPFRNAATPTEICSCLLKLLEVRGEYERDAKRNKQQLTEISLPMLWILSPTASQSVLEGFTAVSDNGKWGTGIYFLPKYLRTAIVAIHQLPKTRETLWLRILGKGRVQNTAIDELEALPTDEPLRSRALELLFSLKTTLEVSQNIDKEDRELIMRLSPLYTQKLEEAERRGERKVVETLLKSRFGSLDNQLSTVIEPLLSLPTEEFTPLLLKLSREELLERFGKQ